MTTATNPQQAKVYTPPAPSYATNSPNMLHQWSGALLGFSLVLMVGGVCLGIGLIAHESTVRYQTFHPFIGLGIGVIGASLFVGAVLGWMYSLGRLLADLEERQRRYQP